MSFPELQDLRSASASLSELAAYGGLVANLSDDRAFPEQVRAAWVTSNLFRLLGYRPLLGRDFNADDDRRDAEPAAIIGYDLWKNRFLNDPSILRKTLRIDGRTATIIGVMPEGMQFPENHQIWAPWIVFRAEQEFQRDSRSLMVVGSLRAGIGREQAQTELTGIARRLAAAHPGGDFTDIRLTAFSERFGLGRVGRIFRVIMVAVCFVLLIACANVANLLLSRSAYRGREMAVRMSLGATRWRLVRQLLVESLVLAFMGGGLGLLLAAAGVPAFETSLQNTNKPWWLIFAVDYTVIGYVAAICVATAVLFGLAPALRLSKASPNSALKETTRSTHGSRRSTVLSGGLVVTELALAVVLLAGAGLLARSFAKMYSLDLGFPPDHLVMFGMDLFGAKYETPEARRAFVNELESGITAIPGVEMAAVTTGVPPRDRMERLLELDPPAKEATFVSVVAITPHFFETLNVALLRGRNFADSDGLPGSETVLINERLASQFFPGQDPIGKRLRFTERRQAPGRATDAWRTIVGITPTIRQGSFQDGYLNAVVYTPYRQEPDSGAYLVVRSKLPLTAISDAVHRTTQRIDPDQPLRPLQTLEEWMATERWPHRVFGGLLSILAILALVLSSVGLYAVMAYAVAHRTQEIGVRMAVGAVPRQAAWLVLKRGLWQLIIGLGLGTAGALAAAQALSGMLVDMQPNDPVTFAAIAILLTVVSIAACLLPARRAARVDPVIALRSE